MVNNRGCALALLLFAQVWMCCPLAAAQKLDARKTQAAIAFAEKFLAKCAKADAKALKELMSLPFFVYAACKGGPHETAESFSDWLLSRDIGDQLPKNFDRRVVVTPEEYLRAIAQESTSEAELKSQLKRIGKSVYVVCLTHGKKDERVSLAVLVRVTRDGMRAVGMGIGLVPSLPPDANEPPFPLRTDPPPKAWKADKINRALPFHWEKGMIHLLAWEVLEHSESWRQTQILVLKRFHQPTEAGGYRWVLAHLFDNPKDEKQPWRREWHIPLPLGLGEKMPRLTNAQIWGHEFYKDIPTNKQIGAFLRESGWTPTLGRWQALSISKDGIETIDYNTKLAAGGIDRSRWKIVFGRDVPTNLFSELKMQTTDEK